MTWASKSGWSLGLYLALFFSIATVSASVQACHDLMYSINKYLFSAFYMSDPADKMVNKLEMVFVLVDLS